MARNPRALSVGALDYRAYQTGNEQSILELFEKSFNRVLSKDWWNWRCLQNPAGQALIELAWDENLLVGHYVVTPIVTFVHGKSVLCGSTSTIMVHPDYRGRGIFGRLGERTEARMIEAGYDLTTSFPNNLSHAPYVKKLKSVDIYEIPFFRLPLTASLCFPTPSEHLEEVIEFDKQFDAFWEQSKENYEVITARDRLTLTWRYLMNKVEAYQVFKWNDAGVMKGYMVIKQYGNEIQIIDLLTVPDVNVSLNFVLKAIQLAQNIHCSSVSLWLNVANPLHAELESLGFRNDVPIFYFTGRVLRQRLSTQIVYDYHRWYLTMGDANVF